MTQSELIRFRKLDSEITNDEFFDKFCKQIGRDTIVSSLFHHFKNDPDATRKATNIQTNIMNQRDEKPKQENLYEQIDKLPMEVISECSSWLDYRDYFKFAQCNRNIYYSLYSHPKIYKLNLTDIADKFPKSASLCAFRNVHNLSMDIRLFNALSASNQQIWANNDSLHSVTLESNHVVFYDHARVDAMRTPPLNMTNVKELSILQCSCTFALDLILAAHEELESLKFLHNDIDWGKLECVALERKSFPKLRKIHFQIERKDIKSLFKWMSNQKALETVKLSSVISGLELDELSLFIEHVAASLIEYKVGARNDRKLHLHFDFDLNLYDTEWENTTVDMKKIVEALNLSNQNNWKLTVEPDSFEGLELCDEVHHLKADYIITYKKTHICIEPKH